MRMFSELQRHLLKCFGLDRSTRSTNRYEKEGERKVGPISRTSLGGCGTTTCLFFLFAALLLLPPRHTTRGHIYVHSGCHYICHFLTPGVCNGHNYHFCIINGLIGVSASRHAQNQNAAQPRPSATSKGFDIILPRPCIR